MVVTSPGLAQTCPGLGRLARLGGEITLPSGMQTASFLNPGPQAAQLKLLC